MSENKYQDIFSVNAGILSLTYFTSLEVNDMKQYLNSNPQVIGLIQTDKEEVTQCQSTKGLYYIHSSS